MPGGRFFTLLREGHRLRNEEARVAIMASAYPHLKASAQQRIQASLSGEPADEEPEMSEEEQRAAIARFREIAKQHAAQVAQRDKQRQKETPDAV
jgi:hypothetical protein